MTARPSQRRIDRSGPTASLGSAVQLGILLFFTGLSLCVQADESRPLYIELKEISPQHYQLQWKTPPSVPPGYAPTVTLPQHCQTQAPLVEFIGPEGLVRRARYVCAQALAAEALTIRYPGPNPSLSSLVRYTTATGEQHILVLNPHETSWSMPDVASAASVARQYTELGIKHIWGGIDHLLFVVCLLWIAGAWRRILVTISGFTVAHSVTLFLSALHFVRIPIPPVEASIALSIVFLASEIVRGPRESLTWRYPIAVSSSFGLLHGFGFAAALSEIGLPQTALVTGLLFFQVGVEIGQVIFAAVVIALMRGLQHLGSRWLAFAWDAHEVALPRVLAGYAVGMVAVFWLIERGAAFWPS